MKRSIALFAVVALLFACADNNAPKSDPGQAGSNTTVRITAEQARKVACDAYNDVRPFIPELRELAVLDGNVEATFETIDATVAAADPDHDLDKLVQRACSGDPTAQEAMTTLRPLLLKLALYEAKRNSKPKTGTF